MIFFVSDFKVFNVNGDLAIKNERLTGEIFEVFADYANTDSETKLTTFDDTDSNPETNNTSEITTEPIIDSNIETNNSEEIVDSQIETDSNEINSVIESKPIPTVVIDAGHGGDDPGALDITGTIKEADIVFKISQQIKKNLEDENINVILTREKDINIGINERADIANTVNADIFLSIHLNSSPGSDASGFQLYLPLQEDKSHNESIALAKTLSSNLQKNKINSFSGESLFYAVYTKSDKLFFSFDDYQNIYSIEGVTFGVLRETNMPSLLIESWFISSFEDMQNYNNEEGINNFSNAISNGVIEYIEDLN